MTTAPKLENHIILFWGIGSGNDAAHRNIGWNVWRDGWQPFIERWIQPAIQLGWKRTQLHNPFGTQWQNREPMEFDQAIEAYEQGMRIVRNTFKAFKPIVKEIEVIAYLGKRDIDFDRLFQNEHQKDSLVRRLTESYAPILDVGCSVGFDALFDTKENEPMYCWMRFLQSLGTKVYVEPWPHLRTPWYWDLANQTTVQLYNARQPNWATPQEKLTGEKIIIMNQPPAGHTWADHDTWCPAWCREMWSRGLTPCIGGQSIIERREPIAEWLKR